MYDPTPISLTSHSDPARLFCVFFKHTQKKEFQVSIYVF